MYILQKWQDSAAEAMSKTRMAYFATNVCECDGAFLCVRDIALLDAHMLQMRAVDSKHVAQHDADLVKLVQSAVIFFIWQVPTQNIARCKTCMHDALTSCRHVTTAGVRVG